MSKEEVCANCGIDGVDDNKLKLCDGGCNLVNYCSDKCRESHREQHEEECKNQKADLRDKELFEQPDGGHVGECPICFLPLPLEMSKFNSCCSKLFCKGCAYANYLREKEEGLEQRCVFCREPVPNSEEEINENLMNRVKKNDPAAMFHLAHKRHKEQDFETALEYWTKAAELGDAEAHYYLGYMYRKGEGVEKDKKKENYHLEEAAIGGHPVARILLGQEEVMKGSMETFERAKKHYIIAANLGVESSLKVLKALYENGHASKEDYDNALRAYQVAVEATKSAEREKGAEFYDEARDAAR